MSEPKQIAPLSLPVPAEPETRPEGTPRKVVAPKRPNARYVEAVNKPEGGVRYDLRPAGYDLVATLAAGGMSEAGIAARLGMSRHTLTEVKKRDPALVAALHQGNGELETECVSELLKSVREGNVIAAMFLLKARCGYRDQGPTDGSNTGSPAVNIVINAPLSPADFLKVVGPLPPESEE